MLCARETSGLSFSWGLARDSGRCTASDEGWHHLPLCRRYQAVLFDASRLQVWGEVTPADRAIVWALGLTDGGQWDVLGVWRSSIAGTSGWPEVFADLKIRGVERVRVFTFPECKEVRQAAAAAFPQAILLPSPGWLQRESLMQVPPRDRLSFAEALDRVCSARSPVAAEDALDAFADGPLSANCSTAVGLWRVALERLAPYYALPRQLQRHVRSGEDIVQGLRESVDRAVTKHGALGDMAPPLVLEALRRAGPRVAGNITSQRPRPVGRPVRPQQAGVAAVVS